MDAWAGMIFESCEQRPLAPPRPYGFVLLGRPAGKSGRSAIEGNSDATDGAKPSTYRTSRWAAARITFSCCRDHALGCNISIAAELWFRTVLLVSGLAHQLIAQFVYFSGCFKVGALVRNLIATVRLLAKILVIAHKYLPRFARRSFNTSKGTTH